MNLTVAMLTCDRFDLTRRAVESLLAHNDASGWNLVYGDDHSLDDRIAEYMESRGFQAIAANRGERVGVTRMNAAIFDAIDGPDDGPVLYLQDDWESRRAIPLDAVRHCLAIPGVGWVRLFYAVHKRRTMRSLPVDRVDGHDFSVGPLDYSDQPHIARLNTARQVFAGAHTEGGAVNNAARLGLSVAMLHPPVMRHAGRNKPVKGSRHGIPRRLRAEYLRKDCLV